MHKKFLFYFREKQGWKISYRFAYWLIQIRSSRMKFFVKSYDETSKNIKK